MNSQTPVLSGKGSADDLLQLQTLARHSLIIGTTRKCPLSCAHCITSSGPKVRSTTLSRDLAQVWAADLPRLYVDGLRHMTFTGGEPILALDAVACLTHAARTLGIKTYIATSGAWARTAAIAKRVVLRVGPVTNWDLGLDGWHADQMPLEVADRALTAICDAGGTVCVRMCEAETPQKSAEMEAKITAMVRGRAPIMRQSVRRLGRGAKGGAATDLGLPERPCTSTGLFLRGDGSTGPCCSGLAYEDEKAHPFGYGLIRAPGDLVAAWKSWRRDPLLRVMRLASMAALEGWLPPAAQGASCSKDPCEACVDLWSRLGRDGSRRIMTRAQAPDVAKKLDALESVLFGGAYDENVC